MIQKIATAAVYVEDQQKALAFWTDQVGFEVHREMPMGPDARPETHPERLQHHSQREHVGSVDGARDRKFGGHGVQHRAMPPEMQTAYNCAETPAIHAASVVMR